MHRDASIYKRADGQKDRRAGERTDGRTGGWADGRWHRSGPRVKRNKRV